MKLSDVKIRNIKGNGKEQKHFDGEGLYLFVTPAGQKYWRMAYRFGGKQKTLSFGLYDMVSLKEARGKRYVAKKLLLDGIDPGEHKKELKAAAAEAQQDAGNTFEAVAREWHPIRTRQISEKQAHRVLRYLETKAFTAFGKKAVTEVTATDILGIIRPIEAKEQHTTADKVLSTCSQVLDYAAITDRIKYNPAAQLRKALQGGETQNLAAVTDPEDIAELLKKD